MIHKCAPILVAWALASTSAMAVGTWDLVGDYLTNTNPNGAWTYGEIPGGVFGPLAWDAGTSSYGVSAVGNTFIFQNTGVFDFGIGTGKVSLEADWGAPAVRWTAPAAGSYQFIIAVGGPTTPGPSGFGNNFATHAGVSVNGVSQTADSFAGNVKAWSFIAALALGETVDTFVLNPGFANGGNTQTDIAVTAVPEPNTAMLLSLGLVLVLVGVRRSWELRNAAG